MLQRTLKSSIGCTGVGLHSGRKIAMTLRPAGADTGIRIRRTDLPGQPVIPVDWRHVADTRMATTVSDGNGASVGTVEHLMAALAGLAIDNAIIDVDGAEIPVMDGSAAPFVFLVECAGVVEQDSPRRAIRILRRVTVRDRDRSISLLPGQGFSVRFEIDFDTKAIDRQALSVQLVNGAFKNELARARTFGFTHEVDALRKAGLALGGSLDNAIVINGNRVLNKEGLRYNDEFVRHKIIDFLGDLYLAGAPIIGEAQCACSGHALNHKLLAALFADERAWCWSEVTPEDFAHGAAQTWAEPAVAQHA